MRENTRFDCCNVIILILHDIDANDMSLKADANVTAWDLYATSSGIVHLQIWRSVSILSHLKYKLVGQMKVNARKGYMHIKVNLSVWCFAGFILIFGLLCLLMLFGFSFGFGICVG